MQPNQGKITIQQGQKSGEQLIWGEVLGQKEYQYYGETRESLEAITWQEAEDICNQKLDASFTILIKAWSNESNSWTPTEERTLVLFIKEEQESVNQNL